MSRSAGVGEGSGNGKNGGVELERTESEKLYLAC